MKTIMGLAAAAAILAVWALPDRVLAHGEGRMGMGMGMGGPGMRVLKELDLSTEQKDAVKGVMEQYRPRMRELRQSRREQRQTLMALTPDDPGYAGAIAEASEQASADAREMVNLMGEVQAAVYALLTDEQKAKAAELRAEFSARQEERRERMRERFLERFGEET